MERSSVGPLSLQEIEGLLPHRPPMRLVDTVVQVSFDPRFAIIATKQVQSDDVCFKGHYPGRPIFPGVLILEGLAPTGLLLFQLSGRAMKLEEVPILASIEGRFVKPVFPGDKLVYRVEIDKRTEVAAIFHGTAEVDDVIVAKGDFSFGVKPWTLLSPR